MNTCTMLVIFAALFGSGLSLQCYVCRNEQCEYPPIKTCPPTFRNPFCLDYVGLNSSSSAFEHGTFCYEAPLDANSSSTACSYFKDQKTYNVDVKHCFACRHDLCIRLMPILSSLSNSHYMTIAESSFYSNLSKAFAGVTVMLVAIVFLVHYLKKGKQSNKSSALDIEVTGFRPVVECWM